MRRIRGIGLRPRDDRLFAGVEHGARRTRQLPTDRRVESGAQGRNRTTDTVIFSHVLYQLSYLGIGVSAGFIEAPHRPVQNAPSA
jgi:hypothetical protein